MQERSKYLTQASHQIYAQRKTVLTRIRATIKNNSWNYAAMKGESTEK